MFKFNLGINNTHKFLLQARDRYNFVIKCEDASMLKSLDLETVGYFIRNKIGREEVVLKEYENILLRDLPLSLSQFIGAYVKLFVKVRFGNFSSFKNNLKLSVGLKSEITNKSRSYIDIIESFFVRVKPQHIVVKQFNHVLGTVGMTISSGIFYKINTSAKYKVGIRARGIIGVKSASRVGCRSNLKVRYNSPYALSTIINNNMIMNYRCKRLVSYNGTKLNTLPNSLKDLCYTETSQ